jgi:hypothetical protein
VGLADYVKRKVAEAPGSGNIGTKVWGEIFEEFGLSKSAADLLEDPEGDLQVDRDLPLALAAASSGNPAGTPSSQLERYLEHCPLLNRAELFGLLRAIMGGPELPRSVASKCQVAALRYFGQDPTIYIYIYI